MNKTLMLLVLLLSGCEVQERSVTDQCLRQVLFDKCMKSLPAGPQATQYNDWDEVVAACGNQAYYMSLRPKLTIKEECRP